MYGPTFEYSYIQCKWNQLANIDTIVFFTNRIVYSGFLSYHSQLKKIYQLLRAKGY